MTKDDLSNLMKLKDEEKLLLQQLQIREWLSNKISTQKQVEEGSALVEESVISKCILPQKWILTRGIELYEWQKIALEKWFYGGKKGTFKIVTGGGKTLLALATIEKLQNEINKDLKVAIVVPTIVLMEQWYREILEKSNIAASYIGRLGGGYKDSFKDGKVILICVLVSASMKLPEIVREADVGSNLFLIVDECHRAGAEQMSRVFSTERAYVMGLSATPERDDESDEEGWPLDYDNSELGKNLGPVLLELTYEDALKNGLIPPFTIKHYGLPLTDEENYEYDKLTRSIKETRSDLLNYNKDRFRGALFYSWAQRLAQQDRGELSQLARKYVADVARRKMLLYRMESRKEAVNQLIKKELEKNTKARILLFHESIEEANLLFGLLLKEGIPVLLEHSELPESYRLKNIELFRDGQCSVLVSVKSLIEGFNVPAVDVGIIVASSTAVRQRIQSMGRVMRPYKYESGREKTSIIHILYAKNTVDEEIYAKYNWEKLTGLNRNEYYHWNPFQDWNPGKNPIKVDGPPRKPPASEMEIDESQLSPGEEYPGEYEGIEYTCDSSNNIKDREERFIPGLGSLAREIVKIKGSPGKFKITPKKHFVIVQKKIEDDWIPFYVTRLDKFPQPVNQELPFSKEPDEDTIVSWVSEATPGKSYPFVQIPLVESNLYFSRKRGGIISKKVKGGELYVKMGNKAQDKNKGEEAEKLVKVINELIREGKKISKLYLNQKGHVLFVEEGNYYFLTKLKYGLEFPGEN